MTVATVETYPSVYMYLNIYICICVCAYKFSLLFAYASYNNNNIFYMTCRVIKIYMLLLCGTAMTIGFSPENNRTPNKTYNNKMYSI